MAKSATDDGGKAKSKLPKIILAVVVAAAGYKFMLAPKKDASATEAGKGGAAAQVAEGEVMSLPELTLNLADEQPRYLRVGIALILEAGTSTESMKGDAPIASDVAVDVLSARTYEDLHAPGAKQAVKEELSKKVREAYEGKKVARVIFTSFVMQ